MRMPLPARVTHRDIAERVGCDKSTVSLALRDDPRLPEATRQKVKVAAESMGYRPDPAIALLARQRWARHETGAGSTIAYLVESRKGDHRLQRRHLAGAQARAEARGYQLTEFDLSAYPSGAAASRVLHHRGIRGLILPAMARDAQSEIQGIEWDKFTVVCCSLGWLRAPFHVVKPDVFEGVRLAWREAISRGYQRIGAALFRHQPAALDDYARIGASYVEQQESVPRGRRVPFLLSEPTRRDPFLRWVEQHRPDAIIGLVAPLSDWLTGAGYRIPQDIGFACLNVWPATSISGISVQFEEVARTAVDLLIAQMHEHQWGVPESQIVVQLTPRWMEGATLPPKGGRVPQRDVKDGYTQLTPAPW